MNIKKNIFMLATTVTMISGAIFFNKNAYAASPGVVEKFVSTAANAGGAKSQAYANQMRNHFTTHPEIPDSDVEHATSLIPSLTAQISAAYANGTLTKEDLASAESLMAALRAKVPNAVPLLNQIMSDVKWGAAQAVSLINPGTQAGSDLNLLQNTSANQKISIFALLSLISLSFTAVIVSQKGCEKKRCFG
ncbi:MAG: hypothetical protein LBS28_02030 [Streptococcaceae bacterium]|jgi:hypothetical protein|nr:hypothetical protein [Streptococcaceae bacterium]